MGVSLIVTLVVGLCTLQMQPASAVMSGEYREIDKWFKSNCEVDNVVGSIMKAQDHLDSQAKTMRPELAAAWERLLELSDVKCDLNALENLQRNIKDADFDPKKSTDSPIVKIIAYYVKKHDEKCDIVYWKELTKRINPMRETHFELFKLGMSFAFADLERFTLSPMFLANCREAARSKDIIYISSVLNNYFERQAKRYYELQPKLIDRKGIWSLSGAAYERFFQSTANKCKAYVSEVDDVLNLIEADIVARGTSFGPHYDMQEALLARDFCNNFVSLDHKQLFDEMMARELFWKERLIERDTVKGLRFKDFIKVPLGDMLLISSEN